MQEHRVTVSGTSYPLPNPFFVLATQNPIEQEGTYPLPEAQLDRFMFNVRLDYPSFEEEVQIVRQTTIDHDAQVQKILSAEEILAFQQLIRRMPVPDNVVEYAVRLVASTRENNKYISWGAGPRASQYLIMGARTHAALQGKYSPDSEDVRAVAFNVLRHRIVRNYFAEAEGITTDQIINELLKL
jgi:MoxR-like ATPase